MKYTIDFLIEKRKEKWNTCHSIEKDSEFREAVSNELVNNESLIKEIKEYPEKLIELLFIVVDKEQQTKPFFFNNVQKEFINILNKAKKDYEEGKITNISILVLKGRQQGFTTLITAIQLAYDLTKKNFQGLTLSDKADNTEAIFQNKAKYTYNALPKIIKPTEKYNNKRQLLFEKMNSSWAVDTATENMGRSRTINFFHGSECAFWTCGIAPVQAGLGEAFTKNCIKIYESTANGYNDYQKMWDSGENINCFFEWWKTQEYRIKFESEIVRSEFLNNVEKSKEWIYIRLNWLKNIKKLDEEQLYWYYKKYKGYLNKELIKQEYPCTAKEAFLLSGKTVFDTEILINRLQLIPKPLKVGYFLYDYDGLTIKDIRWINDKNGYIKIYKLPNSPSHTKYCIGGDTAGDGSDYFTGHVLDAKTGEQVAVLKNQFDPDLYTKQMYCLGMYYKYALISIEANFDSYPIRELQRLGYTNQYVREQPDTYTGKTEKRFGFKTTSLTRPTIISNLIQIVREHCSSINDKDTLEELLTIIRNEKGRIEAPEGGHDDQMMGLAIAHEARSQVTFEQEVINMYSESNFEIRNSDIFDYGEKIEVI